MPNDLNRHGTHWTDEPCGLTRGRLDRARAPRDFVRQCQTPVRILPDDVPAHPYAVALESAHLAPNAQVSIYPWKANPEQIQLALRHVRAFLKANRPASATQQPLAAAAQ